MPPKQPTVIRTAPNRRDVLKTIPLAGLLWFGSVPASAGAEVHSTDTAASAADSHDSQDSHPEVIPLPTGFRPEGIATGRDAEFFVGSLAGGAVYRGDLRTGEGDVFVPAAEDRVAVGLAYDCPDDRLFVAGGPTGKAFVYDAETGETAAAYDLTDPGTFVNDVVVTPSAAYFTDSARAVLYRVPLGPDGELAGQCDVAEVPLGGDFELVPDAFNANGIDAPPDGDFLVVVNSTTGLLYKVDPASGRADEIDLGGETLTAGDGLLLDDRTLYVVRNRLNRIAVVELDADATAGEVVGEITRPEFDVPTTIAAYEDSLYAVNARFGIDSPETAEYSVVRVPKDPDA